MIPTHGRCKGVDIPTVPAKEPKPRKSKKGYKARHPAGVLTRRPHGGARDTKPRAIHIKHAAQSRALMEGRLDGRSLLGRAYKERLAELIPNQYKFACYNSCSRDSTGQLPWVGN